MQFVEREVDGVSILELSGNLTVTDDPGRLLDQVAALLGGGARRIVLDAGRLDYVDSSCLGELVTCYRMATAMGGSLKIAKARPHLQHLLEITKLDTVFDSHASESSAVASFAALGGPASSSLATH